MTEKQTIIDKLYALRAGMSILSMRYDSYYNIRCEMDDIYVANAKKINDIIKSNLDSISYSPPWDYKYNMYNSFVDYIHKYQKYMQTYQKYDAYCFFHNDCWYKNIYQPCYYDIINYVPDIIFNTYYKQRKTICDNFNYRGIIVNKAQFDAWIDTFVGKADYILDNANRAIQCIQKNPDSVLYPAITDRIRDITIGEWLLTDESRKHFKRKHVELIEILNIISSSIENLKPHGFLEKLFNKNKNISEINKNQETLNCGLIAAHNTENALKFIERKTPEIKATIENLQQKIDPIKLEYNQIFRALQDEFSLLLDVRDWENLDIVIYFMETGRADTIKEALQQVDMEKRTDRIINTIHEATDRICSTIAMGFASLNASMMQCFAVIESRIAEQTALLAEQNSTLAELTSITSINNALIAKQNTSSEKLMKDIKSLKSVVKTK